MSAGISLNRLQTSDPRKRLTEIFEQRDPLYREVAHIVIETGSPSLASLVTKLEAKLVAHHQGQAANLAS